MAHTKEKLKALVAASTRKDEVKALLAETKEAWETARAREEWIGLLTRSVNL